ncbi:MAG TPA: hypothetical protein VIX89_00545 [Bryobacteraceae bacterium]
MSVAKLRHPSKTVRETLAYFIRNPAALDSLEGIAHWRLLEQTIHKNLVETQKAVEWLVKCGYVVEEGRPSTPRMFRLNPDKLHEAESLLNGTRRPAPGKRR